MPKPVRIFIGGKELENYTSMRLSRSKQEMTGSLTVEIFLSYLPQRPVVVNASVAREITVYVGQQLAFIGSIDARNGQKVKQKRADDGQFESGFEGDGGIVGRMSSDGYKVTLTARGKTKALIDSSHQHKTGNILKTTNKKAIEELVKPWKIELDWQATEIDMPIVRFNDGGRALDEVRRIANETCVFVYETRDGKLRAIDRPGAQVGMPMVLGRNILDFDATQSESRANSTIVIKGQRTDPNIHGKDAVNRVKVVKDNWVVSDIPLTIQLLGDATDQALERRGKFEADQRAAQSKKADVTMFGFLQDDGSPFDIGNLHYVEIPPEGIFDVMECVDIEYTVDANGTYQTRMGMAPPPSSGVAGGANAGDSLTSEPIPGLSDAQSLGNTRRAQFSVVTEPGDYPFSWGPASLVIPIPPVVAPPLNPLLQAAIPIAVQLVLKD